MRFPAFQKTSVVIPPLGLCDLLVYVTGQDEFTAGTLDPSAQARPYDGFVIVRVKTAWDVAITTEFDELTKFMERARNAIHAKFNNPMRVAFRATVGTRQVRLRLLFAPRFICSTFPEKGDTGKYLGGMSPALPRPFQAHDYTGRVQSLIAKHGVHVSVRLADGSPGVTGTGTTARHALVRNDGSFLLIFTDSRFDDDTVAMFGQMVGSLSNGAPRSAADLKPLADALVAAFGPDISTAVPEQVVL